MICKFHIRSPEAKHFTHFFKIHFFAIAGNLGICFFWDTSGGVDTHWWPLSMNNASKVALNVAQVCQAFSQYQKSKLAPQDSSKPAIFGRSWDFLKPQYLRPQWWFSTGKEVPLMDLGLSSENGEGCVPQKFAPIGMREITITFCWLLFPCQLVQDSFKSG